jgi:glycosyltransferase involved in cell wall biosynthesis
MKVLLIARTYIVKINQKKIQELALYSDIEIKVIVPQIWQEAVHPRLVAENPSTRDFIFCPMPTLFTGEGGRYLYRTLDLSIRKFKPDIIQVEEDTRGLTVFQAAFYKKIWAPKAKFIPFTWANIETPLFKPLYCFEKFTLSQADSIICGNTDAARNIRRKGFARPVHIIPQLGIDMDFFKFRDASQLRNNLHLSPQCFVIGFAGRMVKEKGPLLLIDSVAKLKGDWVLLMIGNGPEREEIRRRALMLGIADHIRMINPVPHYELAKYFNVMDVLVSPSISTPVWKEQFGLVVAQAMSSQVPIVGSTCGETPNLIGEAGLIFNEGDTVTLTNHLSRLRDDKTFRINLGKLGIERIRNNYSFNKIAAQTYQVWRDLYYGN